MARHAVRWRAVMLLVTLVAPAAAQVSPASPVDTSNARCDSLFAAARVDSVPVKFSAQLTAVDGQISRSQRDLLLSDFLAALVLPQPFRLAVFSSGVPTTRALRRIGATDPELRAPTVTGVYEFTLVPHDSIRSQVVGAVTLRPSLVPGLDSAVVRALSTLVVATDSALKLELRFTTQRAPGAEPLIASTFPRLRIVDAVPLETNPAPAYPEAEKSGRDGEVVLRFVVDRHGVPVPTTVELVRATGGAFVAAALETLANLRFKPAMAAVGCPVAQVVDYPFSFVMPR